MSATRSTLYRFVLSVALSLVPLLAGAADGVPEHGILDYLIVVFGVLIVIGVAIFTVRYFVRPGEKSGTHIKRRILDPNSQEGDDER